MLSFQNVVMSRSSKVIKRRIVHVIPGVGNELPCVSALKIFVALP